MLTQVLVVFRRHKRPQTLMSQNTSNSSLYHITLSKSQHLTLCLTCFRMKHFWKKGEILIIYRETIYVFHRTPSFSLSLSPLNIHMRKCVVLMTAWKLQKTVQLEDDPFHFWTANLSFSPGC